MDVKGRDMNGNEIHDVKDLSCSLLGLIDAFCFLTLTCSPTYSMQTYTHPIKEGFFWLTPPSRSSASPFTWQTSGALKVYLQRLCSPVNLTSW